MKAAWLIALLCCTGLTMAAEGEPMPGIGPRVDLQPLLPRPSVETVGGDERMLRELESTVQRLDRDIAGILSRYQGMRPAVRLQHFPELDQARQRRDASWQELQDALDAVDLEQPDSDLLDTPGSKRSQDDEERRLQAENQLSVVECLYDLGTAPEPDAQAIEDGRVILATIPYQELPIAKRPLVHYFRFAFTLQQARRSEGATRTNLLNEARRHRDLLRREFPDSYLAGTADSLLANADFDLTALEAAEPDDIAPPAVPRP